MKHISKLWIFFIVMAISALVVCHLGVAADSTTREALRGGNAGTSNSFPTPERISIVASTPVPHSMSPTRKAYQELSECGFNMMFESVSAKSSERILKLIAGLDLKIMWSNPGIRQEGSVDLLNKFKMSPQVAGWQFQDEPRFDTLDEMQKYYELVKKALPDKLIYINLIGANYKQFCGDSPDYVSYLHMIDKRFAPQIWSYDIYPISVKNDKEVASLDYFYSDFEIFSKLSRETGRPFWAYCQSMAFKNKSVERPAATLPYLRFEAFSALAYGAQGIVYWTYGQRHNQKNETYFSALVDLNGNKTPAWYAAQQVNREIIAFNDVFYKSELVECRHTGDKLYPGTQKLTKAIGPLERVVSGSKGVIVSHLRTSGKDYIVIVSRDPFNSQTLRLNFGKEYSIKELTPIVGDGINRISKRKVEGNFKKTLDAGGYMVFAWEQ